MLKKNEKIGLKGLKKKKEKMSPLEEAIYERVERLKDCYDDEEKEAIDNLKKLSEVKDSVEGSAGVDVKINPNTVLSAVTSLGGILLILNFERLGVITSKALTFIPRLKL